MNTVRTDPRRICGLLLLGVLAIGFGFGCGEDALTSPTANQETYEDSTDQSLDLTGVARVVAGTSNGAILVRGQASTSAHLEIRKTVRAPTLAEAQQIADLIDVDVQVIADELVIQSTYPEPPPGVNVRVDYDLVGPAGVDLDLEVANGEISAESMNGAVIAGLANGRIDITCSADAGEAVTAGAANGIIAVVLPDNGTWDVTATTATGCIRGDLGGSVVDQCGPGMVRMGAVGGIPCDLSVVNGTIEINGS